MVWRNADISQSKDGDYRRTTGKYKVYCPEPVGPATTNNATSVVVTDPTTGISGTLGNTQTVGKVYDMTSVVQFSQYALFMNCIGWANGTVDSAAYSETMDKVLESTADLIKAQIETETKAKVDAASEAVVSKEAEVTAIEKAEDEHDKKVKELEAKISELAKKLEVARQSSSPAGQKAFTSSATIDEITKLLEDLQAQLRSNVAELEKITELKDIKQQELETYKELYNIAVE